MILDSLSQDTLTTFENILQGFKIIAKDSTGLDSTKIRIKVTTEDDVPLPVARMNKSNTKSNAKEKGQSKTESNDDETILPDWIVPGGPILIEGFGDVVVKEDECNEEIVVCNNYQPPKFEDVSIITELGENDPWQWIDEQENPQTTNASNGCNIIDLGEIGLTYIMGTIGDLTINQQPVYTRLDDMRVTACADKSNPIPSEHIWRFSVENMRIPIFRDHCPAWAIANDYVDLLDGTNADTLVKYIKNCKDYSDVMGALEWWKNLLQNWAITTQILLFSRSYCS